MALTEQLQQEERKKSDLDAKRYRKQTFQQQFRGELLQRNQEQEEDKNIPQESRYKRAFSMAQAGALKKVNTEAGKVTGRAVGGFFGSILPFIGTAIGAFIGGVFGKKAGITGIIIFVAFLLFFALVVLIAVLKGYCDTYIGTAADYFTTNICPNLK